ncbi:SusD/RagB family nutrient-binding outer membrane lipoprotein [Negadavirga shengliensis]|uniref:SusD/RagB family nutrient-binding outer membrane lipoprotein n=1 Tax=Negadavirga shengliensis TaxID=1389218 RepID=A0ABV9T7H8_9BACT
MKIKIILMTGLLAGSLAGCKMSDFEENYTDPSKLPETTVGKQFTGMIFQNRGDVLPSYWNYFVIHRLTSNRYNQAVGWVNVENQYVPGSAAVNDRWNRYYQFVAQYREVEKVYAGLSDAEKNERRIYMIAAATYFYDFTQQMIDLYGDLPWSQAGMLSTNGGDYTKSYPAYDQAESIYTKMLDDLAGFADELRTISLNQAVEAEFKTQDLINWGDIDMWRKYVNSLRLRMLTRVSGTGGFGSRAKSEINAILSNPGNYPIVTSNADNITFRIHELGTLMSATDFQSGLEDWDGNIAGKAIIDHMLDNNDPRLSYIFEPGENAEGAYMGLDPLMNPSAQNELVGTLTLSRYNRSTISRNQYFPGLLVTAAEVHLLAAEYYLRENLNAQARDHYEEAIRQSMGFYQFLRSLSNNSESPAPVVPTAADMAAYLAQPAISWDAAASLDDRIGLIARQKWLHLNVVQPNENWAELRRLDALGLVFRNDDSNQQSQPPSRWMYPGVEQSFNAANYSAVQSKDKLTTKIFWDVD